jgi:hypothetical protein
MCVSRERSRFPVRLLKLARVQQDQRVAFALKRPLPDLEAMSRLFQENEDRLMSPQLRLEGHSLRNSSAADAMSV